MKKPKTNDKMLIGYSGLFVTRVGNEMHVRLSAHTIYLDIKLESVTTTGITLHLIRDLSWLERILNTNESMLCLQLNRSLA